MKTKAQIKEEIRDLEKELQKVELDEKIEKLKNPIKFAEWLALKGCIYINPNTGKVLFLFDGEPKEKGLTIDKVYNYFYINQYE